MIIEVYTINELRRCKFFAAETVPVQKFPQREIQ